MQTNRLLLAAIAAVSCLSILCAALGVGFWPLEPFGAFLLQATLTVVVFGAFALRARRHGAAAILACFSLIGLIKLAQVARTDPPIHTAPCCVDVTVGHVNLFGQKRGLETLRKWADKENIEILALTELPGGAFDVENAFPDYPYILIGDQKGRRKVAILSKFPAKKAPSGSDAVLAAIAHIEDGLSLPVFTTHPTIPKSPRDTKRRDAAIESIFSEAAAHPHALVMGDFNATPWSPVLSTASAQHEFKRSSSGAFQSTWITPVPAVGVPLDHIYASYEIDINRSGIGPFVFSDHWPIRATVSVPRPDAP